MNQVLLLGEAPNEATARRPDLWLLPDDSGISHAANRLLEFTGWPRELYLRAFRRDNLLRELPPRAGRGRAFPLSVARAQVGRVFAEWPGPIVVLGVRLSRAFAWRAGTRIASRMPPPLSWLEVERGGEARSAAMVPHSSGLNRWWNLPGNREAGRWFFDRLREWVEG